MDFWFILGRSINTEQKKSEKKKSSINLKAKIMKQRIFILGSFAVILAFLLISCEEKKDEPDPLVGTYTFSSATFNDTVVVVIQENDFQFQPGSSAAEFVSNGLLGAAPCDNAQNAAVELREDGTGYMVCLNEENEEQMGTWFINSDRTILTLNISNPMPFALTISNLNITENAFSGTVENFPLPKDTSVPLGQMLPGNIPNYQAASVDLTFTRVP